MIQWNCLKIVGVAPTYNKLWYLSAQGASKPIEMLRFMGSLTKCSGRSRIFRMGSGVDLLEGCGPLTWALFSKNVCKNKRIGSHRRGMHLTRPLDLPMKWYQRISKLTYLHYLYLNFHLETYQWRIQDFPLGGTDLCMLFGGNQCENERIGSCWGARTSGAPWIRQCLRSWFQ